MTSAFDEYSSFCFLDQKDMRKVMALSEEIDMLREQLKVRLSIGFAEAKDINARPVASPKRNPMESGDVYDKAINQMVKLYLTQSDAFLKRKWDACSDAADCLLDLIAKQREARSFLEMADEKRPPDDAKQAWRQVERMPEATCDALDELYDRMCEFTSKPLAPVYERQSGVLAQIAADMQRVATEHARFWPHAADEAEDRQRIIARFDDHKKSASEELNRVSDGLVVGMGHSPNLREMLRAYERSLETYRGLG